MVVPSAQELEALAPINFSPTSTRGRLNTLILSDALNFSLMYEYESHVYRLSFSFPGVDVPSLFVRFKDVRRKTSEVSELDEVSAAPQLEEVSPFC